MSPLQTVEFAVLDFINHTMHNSFLDMLMPLISSLGNAGLIWIFFAILMLCSRQYRKNGWIVLFSLLLCLLIGNLMLKPLVARIRPFDINTLTTLLIAAPTDFSFPSGHTMSSFAAASSICYANRRLGFAALILAALIAFSRLYLYLHYPTDVLGGLLLGLGASFIAIATAKYLECRRAGQNSR